MTCTGVNMAPRPDVTCHLVTALNSLCGRFNRAGDVVRNPGALLPPRVRYADVEPPRPLWGSGPRSRFRGLGQFMGEMPINVFADEILTPGEGQIKALVCVGGNPAVAFPNQRKVVAALQELDADAEVRCIVVGGSEQVFAAGADIGEMATATAVEMYVNRRVDACDAIRAVRTPLVAAVSGFCLGGGCELAMACDVVVASETAVFGQPETGLGLIPGANIGWE